MSVRRFIAAAALLCAAVNPACAQYADVAAVQAATIASSVAQITTRSYFAAFSYGGGTYNRVASAPSHALYIQSADGAYWELLPANGKVFPTQAGANTASGTDNQSALDNAYAYAVARGAQLYFETPGIYRHSATWALGSSACIIPNIDFVGPDNAVSILHTGTGVNVSLDAGTTARCYGGQIGQTGRPLLTGNANTIDNLLVRSYHHLNVRVFAGDSTSSGAHVQFSVLSNFDIKASANARPAYVTKPAYGALFELRGPGEFSSGNRVHAVIEGLTHGVRNDGLQASTWTGSIEGNSGYGYLGTGNAGRNIFQNVDNEANGSTDWSFAGEDDSWLQMPIGISPVTASLNIGAGSDRIKVSKGIFYNINVNSGATRAELEGVGYSNSFVDDGTDTTWKNLYSLSGTGAATFMVDRLGTAAAASIVTGDLTVTGKMVNQAPLTSAWTLNAGTTSGVSPISIAAGGNAPIATGEGMIVVYEGTTSGTTALFMVSGGSAFLVAEVGTHWSVTTAPASGNFGIAFDGVSNYRIYNGAGATRNFFTTSFRVN